MLQTADQGFNHRTFKECIHTDADGVYGLDPGFWSTALRSVCPREVELLLSEGVNATLCRKATRKETVRFWDPRRVLFRRN